MSEQEQGIVSIDLLAERKQQEMDLILARIGEFEAKVEGEDFPQVLVLLDVGRGMVLERGVLAERDGKITAENWVFVTQAQTAQDIGSLISPELNLSCQSLAAKIGAAEECIFEATIKTKVLMDNFKDGQPLFLEFGEGPEGLRLENVFLLSRLPDGRVRLQTVGYRLEYYSSFEEKERIPLRSLLAHVNLEKVDFVSLFPAVLFFTSFVWQ